MISNEEKILSLDEEHSDLVEEPSKAEGWKGTYAWGLITYATPDEFQPILERAEHWAYIYHDKDIWTESEIKQEIKKLGQAKHTIGAPKEAHYHIVCRFSTETSLSVIRKLQKGTSNVLGKKLKSITMCIKLEAYFTHNTEKARKVGKHIYDIGDLVQKENDDYWQKQLDKELEEQEKSENQKASNEDFLNDLLAENFSLREMAVKYGRDFIKNFDKYMRFRGLFTENPYAPTELDIKRKERELDQAINSAQLDLEELYETPTGVDIDLEVRKIRLEKAKNGNQN